MRDRTDSASDQVWPKGALFDDEVLDEVRCEPVPGSDRQRSPDRPWSGLDPRDEPAGPMCGLVINAYGRTMGPQFVAIPNGETRR